jgi:hypothetical protein
MPDSEYLEIIVGGGELVVRKGGFPNFNIGSTKVAAEGEEYGQVKLSRQVTAGDMAEIVSVINSANISLFHNSGLDCTGGPSSFVEFEQGGQLYKVHFTKDELCRYDGDLLYSKKTKQDFSKIENALLNYLKVN